MEHIFRHKFFCLTLNHAVLLRLLLELFLDVQKALLEHMIVVLGRTLKWLSHDAFDHFFVALDFELTIYDARHVLLHLLLSLHHELLSLNRVHPSDLEIVFFVLFHAPFK